MLQNLLLTQFVNVCVAMQATELPKSTISTFIFYLMIVLCDASSHTTRISELRDTLTQHRYHNWNFGGRALIYLDHDRHLSNTTERDSLLEALQTNYQEELNITEFAILIQNPMPTYVPTTSPTSRPTVRPTKQHETIRPKMTWSPTASPTKSSPKNQSSNLFPNPTRHPISKPTPLVEPTHSPSTASPANTTIAVSPTDNCFVPIRLSIATQASNGTSTASTEVSALDIIQNNTSGLRLLNAVRNGVERILELEVGVFVMRDTSTSKEMESHVRRLFVNSSNKQGKHRRQLESGIESYLEANLESLSSERMNQPIDNPGMSSTLQQTQEITLALEFSANKLQVRDSVGWIHFVLYYQVIEFNQLNGHTISGIDAQITAEFLSNLAQAGVAKWIHDGKLLNLLSSYDSRIQDVFQFEEALSPFDQSGLNSTYSGSNKPRDYPDKSKYTPRVQLAGYLLLCLNFIFVFHIILVTKVRNPTPQRRKHTPNNGNRKSQQEQVDAT